MLRATYRLPLPGLAFALTIFFPREGAVIDFLDQLNGQLERLERLAQKDSRESGALEAVRAAATEIERVAAEDLAADYARDIRLAVASHVAAPGPIAETPVGEAIERLADYCSLVQQGGPEAAQALRPWR
jgi:hypothetical protein